MKTINNPNQIASIGRTNNPNPIASTGRINFKKVISAILLFSLLFFFLLAGANSLQAQERKTGWFGTESLCNGSKFRKKSKRKQPDKQPKSEQEITGTKFF